MAELGAFFGNPNIQRQGARARALAGQRDVNTLPDPLTYAVVQGLLGTRPDEMGFSVLNPDYEKIKKVAEPAFALGLLGQAAPALAPLTKGLPVGASIKNVGKFDVVKRDASDIFGEGAQRIRYTDPKSNGSIEVLARQDGTASVLSLEVPEKFRGKKIGENLQKQVLEDFPDMQGQVSSKAAATTAYRIGRRPVDMPDATLKDVHKMIDEDSSVNMISPQMQERINPSASYPQQEALDTAQRNAALPIEEGGLGLPKDNTPEMRAAVMFPTDLLHGTAKDFPSFDLSKAGTNTRQAGDELGIFSTSKPFLANDYALIASRGGWANRTDPENAVVYPLVGSFKNPKKYQTASEFYRDADAMAVEQKLGNWREQLQKEGYDSVFVRPDLEEVVAFNPDQLRSRFAAFDPFRRDTETALQRGVAPPDLLAGVLPLGLLTDEDQRKKLYEMLPSLLGQ